MKLKLKEAVIQESKEHSSAPAVTVAVPPKITPAVPIIHLSLKSPDPGVI